MRLSAFNNIQNTGLPVRRRYHRRRSLSVISWQATEPEFDVSSSKHHARSHSLFSSSILNSNENGDLSDSLRFILESVHLNPSVPETSTPSLDEKVVLCATLPPPLKTTNRDNTNDDDNDLPWMDDCSSVTTVETAVQEDSAPRWDEDCCWTPEAQVIHCRDLMSMQLSPPPLLHNSNRPTIYLDLSSAVASGLFLPDAF